MHNRWSRHGTSSELQDGQEQAHMHRRPGIKSEGQPLQAVPVPNILSRGELFVGSLGVDSLVRSTSELMQSGGVGGGVSGVWWTVEGWNEGDRPGKKARKMPVVPVSIMQARSK